MVEEKSNNKNIILNKNGVPKDISIRIKRQQRKSKLSTQTGSFLIDST